MRNIQLMRLTLENFKGQDRFVLEIGGRNADIYGDNAAGKTTLYDALTWLLFGKDSEGRSDFDIKPLDSSGNVRDHAAVTAVEALLRVDGEDLALRKTYFERWSIKRGSAAESFDGNTSEYYADGVPVKKYEFDSRVAELIPEDHFRMLTGVGWFCVGMDWKLRRKALFELCGVASDAEIMVGVEQFAPLAEAIGRLDIDGFRAKVQAERKSLSGARDSTPARMDECKKTVEELSGIDFDALRVERGDTARHLEQLRSELLSLRHGTLLDGKRNELAAKKNELNACINENERFRAGQAIPVRNIRPELEAALARNRQELLRYTGLAQNEDLLIEEQRDEIASYKAVWMDENARTFTAKSCPTCGQPMPADQQEAAKVRFDEEKERRKQDAVSRSNRCKETVAKAEERREQYIQGAAAAEKEIARLTDELAVCVPEKQPEIKDMDGYAACAAELRESISTLQAEVDKLTGESAAIRCEIEEKAASLNREIERLDGEIAKAGTLDYAQKRMEALRAQARETASRIEQLDQMLFLCDEFIRYKTAAIEERVNNRFRLVKWRLFQEQVNGGISDCCEATVAGVPYASLNNGARINAGLDVIGTLSACYGERVPLFIDNAESVTTPLAVDTQVIRLVVSEKDKTLRCEYEN